MSDLSQSTISFLEAMRLEEGYKRVYTFSSVKEADSFRVSLYAVKRKLRDNTVLIAISGTTITMLKKSKVVEVLEIAPDGAVTEVSQERENTSYQKKVSEILVDAEDIPEELRADFVREAIEQLNTTPRRAS